LKPYCENQKDADILRDYITPRNEIMCPDNLIDNYGHFLQEGDFEHWQKYCYMEDCKEKRREHLRAMWILSRFYLFGSYEWSQETITRNALWEIVKHDN